MRRSSSVLRAGVLVRLQDRFHQQRFRFSRAGRAAEQAVFRGRGVELLLLGKGIVAEIDARGGVVSPALGAGCDCGRHIWMKMNWSAAGPSCGLRKCNLGAMVTHHVYRCFYLLLGAKPYGAGGEDVVF